MVFTQEQEDIINQGVDWFKNSSEQVFEICGEAGTGKSVVLYEIIRRLGLSTFQYLPMAYTGQASIVMRLKGFPHSRSIHSTLYEYTEHYKDYNPYANTKFNAPVKERTFSLKSRDALGPVILFVFDESFQIPLQMRKDIESFGIKCLVAGDDGQLPPVYGEPAYLTGYGVHRLTQLMRQAEGSPIIYIARRARRGLPIHCGIYGYNALVIEDRDLNPELMKLSNAIVCGTNVTRDIINRYVRESILDIHSDLPVFGDRMICRNNNWSIERDGISLANGLVGTVVNSPNVSGFDGKTFKIDFAPDLCHTVFDGVEVDYEYYKAPYTRRKDIKFNKYNKGEDFEYAYALTTHLTQGAEFNTGMYIEEFLRPNIQNQLNYTGITRFKQFLIYVKKSKNFSVYFGQN